MTLAAIVAHDPNLVIGLKGEMPWHYSDDLKYFKRITMGHPIVMGRVVFVELNEKPLPGRENIVLSRSRNFHQVSTFSSIYAVLEHVEGVELFFVIGGYQLFEQLFPE